MFTGQHGRLRKTEYVIPRVNTSGLCYWDTQFSFDIHESVHHDIITKTTNKMQLCRLIYNSFSALHVSGGVFAHHQEHLTVFTASGGIH
jgi:hypothetical protein